MIQAWFQDPLYPKAQVYGGLGVTQSGVNYGQKFGVDLQLKHMLGGGTLPAHCLPDFQLIFNLYHVIEIDSAPLIHAGEVLALGFQDQ